MQLTGIVLAGGSSSRMGTDKGMMVFRGKRLVEYSLDLLGRYCNELIISTNNQKYGQFNARIINDDDPGKGPVSGLATSLIHSGNEWNIVLGCDMPFVNDALIELLTGNKDESPGVVPVHGNYYEPVTALYHRAAGRIFKEELCNGNYSLLKILHAHHFTLINSEKLLAEFPLLFKNFNSPEDFDL